MNINELLDKRVLMTVSHYGSSGNVEEFKIIEVSPSGAWVKLMNCNGRKFWKQVPALGLVEVLRDIEPAPHNKGDL